MRKTHQWSQQNTTTTRHTNDPEDTEQAATLMHNTQNDVGFEEHHCVFLEQHFANVLPLPYGLPSESN
jgi:hypothetical protein